MDKHIMITGVTSPLGEALISAFLEKGGLSFYPAWM